MSTIQFNSTRNLYSTDTLKVSNALLASLLVLANLTHVPVNCTVIIMHRIAIRNTTFYSGIKVIFERSDEQAASID